MMRKLMVAAGALAILAAVLLAQEGSKTKPEQPEAPAAERAAQGGALRPSIDKFLQSYREAFNKNDAAAVAAHWSEQGVYVDRETGERSEGREHLQADFEQLFSDHGGAQLSVEVFRVRPIKPDVVVVEGSAKALLPDAESITTEFSAVLTKQEDQWQIDSVNESPPAAPTTAFEALQELEWMVGHWVDDSEAVKVDTTVRWGSGGMFLVRTFFVEPQDESPLEGTQVIGWDPRLGQIRSWKFFSDGSFGEERWSKSGEDWLVTGTHTLADGRLAAGTQVIRRMDDDTQLVRLIGRDIDGAPAPSTEEVRVVRVADSDEPADDSASAAQEEARAAEARDVPARAAPEGDKR